MELDHRFVEVVVEVDSKKSLDDSSNPDCMIKRKECKVDGVGILEVHKLAIEELGIEPLHLTLSPSAVDMH